MLRSSPNHGTLHKFHRLNKNNKTFQALKANDQFWVNQILRTMNELCKYNKHTNGCLLQRTLGSRTNIAPITTVVDAVAFQKQPQFVFVEIRGGRSCRRRTFRPSHSSVNTSMVLDERDEEREDRREVEYRGGGRWGRRRKNGRDTGQAWGHNKHKELRFGKEISRGGINIQYVVI